jgi:hypothetical protein
MKIKSLIAVSLLLLTAAITNTGCKKDGLENNPNIASANSTVPVSLILNHITSSIIRNSSVVSNSEEPWGNVYRLGQYYVANYSYYWGSNFYNWSNSDNTYDLLKYAVKLEEQAQKQFGNTTNVYFGVSKFIRAYSAVWLAQRVGDIPMKNAGDPSNLTPAYDTQKDVFKNALKLLDDANSIFASKISTANSSAKLDAAGDIFSLTNLQWQKLINTYKLRLLISLSKRAVDNADLNVQTQFANIVNNSATYPIMTSNADNVKYVYNAATNQYPIVRTGNTSYNNYNNIGKTYLDITTANLDPRTFIAATPAPIQIKSVVTGGFGKTISDFTAYVGADNNTSQSVLFTDAPSGKYSYPNYTRYYTSAAGLNCEPYLFMSYAELCFNVAEGINRGWVSGSAATWYNNGINASLSLYGLSNGQSFNIGDLQGASLGSVTINTTQFLTNANVIYAGDNTAGLTQILQQKYVAMFNNSGWEAFYNWRRTGIPTFSQGSVGIGTTTNLIPRRWMYPQSEIDYNTTNYKAAIQSQFGGTDDVTKDTWLTK